MRFDSNMIKNTFFFSCFWLCLTIVLNGCADEGEWPSYLYLKPYTIAPQTNVGTSNQHIEDYWVYTDNDLIGVFAPDRVAPVLKSGPHDILIYPGVRTNGQRDNANIYPFLAPYTVNKNLCACGKSDTIRPVFEYKSNVTFSFISDFEQFNIFNVDRDKDAQTKLYTESDTVFEGQVSGQLAVTEDHPTNIVGTSEFFTDYKSEPREIYLELNYKSSALFEVGLEFEGSIKYPSATSIVGFYPSDKWKKVYINIAPYINDADAKGGCRIVLFSVYNIGNPLKTQNVFVDNIKMIHF